MQNTFARPGLVPVNIEWVIEGHARAEAAALAKFDAAWDAAYAEYQATGKADWPVNWAFLFLTHIIWVNNDP